MKGSMQPFLLEDIQVGRDFSIRPSGAGQMGEVDGRGRPLQPLKLMGEGGSTSRSRRILWR